MAMTMTGEATLPAARPKVWALLNDPEVLKACIPGCQSLEKVGRQRFRRGRQGQDRPGFGDLQRQGRAHRHRSGRRLHNLRRRRRRRRRLRQGRRQGVARRRRGRHAAALRRRGPCRREDRPARLAPDRRRRQGHGRQVLRQFRRGSRQGRARRRSAGASDPCRGPHHASSLERRAACAGRGACQLRRRRRPLQPLRRPPGRNAAAGRRAPQWPRRHQVSPPKKTSWFRRIWEWFMSR